MTQSSAPPEVRAAVHRPVVGLGGIWPVRRAGNVKDNRPDLVERVGLI